MRQRTPPSEIILEPRDQRFPGSLSLSRSVGRVGENPGNEVDLVVDHHRKSVLDKHLSAVSHIKRMDESSSKRAKQQTLKTSFKCKTPPHEEKVKVCHEWIRRALLQTYR